MKKPEETNMGDTSFLCGVFEMIGAATIPTMQYQDKTSGFFRFMASYLRSLFTSAYSLLGRQGKTG